MEEKEFLYVGYYISNNNEFILKIGTTNDLTRRKYEHNTNYRKAKKHTLPKDQSFTYLWWHKLSKYNTIRYEDKNRELWKEMGIGEYVKNDRFICLKPPENISIKIRKEYNIEIAQKIA